MSAPMCHVVSRHWGNILLVNDNIREDKIVIDKVELESCGGWWCSEILALSTSRAEQLKFEI